MAKKKQDELELQEQQNQEQQEDEYVKLYNQMRKGAVDPLNRKYLTTGHATIDKLLSEGKGLPLGCYIELSSKSGLGKCVTGDSIVFVNNKLKKIEEDITEEGYTEASNDNNILSRCFNETFSYRYKKQVNTIVTINDVHGNVISGTPEHPVMVKQDDNYKWVKLKDITLNSNVVMSSLDEMFLNEWIDCDKTDNKELFLSYLEGYNLLKNKSYWEHGFLFEVSSYNIDKFQSYLELNNIKLDESFDDDNERCLNQYKKYYHKKIGKEDKWFIRIDLNHLDNETHNTKLYNQTTNYKFYRELSLNEFFYKLAGCLDAYSVIGFNSNDQFFKKISLFFDSKDDVTVVQRMLAMFGIIGHQSVVNGYKHNYCLNLGVSSSYVLANVLKHRCVLKKTELVKFLDMFDNMNVKQKENYLTVSEINNEAKECFVYDYTIPKTHCFIVNGVVSHNTTLILDIVKHICEQGKRVIYIDSETGLSDNLIKKMGLKEYTDNNLFVIFPTTTFNKAGQILDCVVKDPKISLIIVDSITQLTPDELVEDGKKISDGQIGIQARYTGNLLKRYRERINNNEKSIIFINQMRTHIPTGYGNAYEAPAGANAQQFTMDIRLIMKKCEEIKAEDGHPIGWINKISAIKNRCGECYKEYTVKLIFGKGIDENSEYSDWLIANGVVEKKPAGIFILRWNGEEMKIRGLNNYEKWVTDNFEEIKSFVEANGGLIPLYEGNEEDNYEPNF